MDPTTSTLGRARVESPPTHGHRRDRGRETPATGGAHLRQPLARSIYAPSRSSPLTHLSLAPVRNQRGARHDTGIAEIETIPCRHLRHE